MIEDLFKLEIVDDFVVCKPLTERLKNILSDVSMVKRITERFKRSRPGLINYSPVKILFTEEELKELEAKRCRLYGFFYISFLKDVASLRVDISVYEDDGEYLGKSIRERFIYYDKKFTRSEFLSNGSVVKDFFVASVGDWSNGTHTWDDVPILACHNGLKNLDIIYSSLDKSTKSTLSIFDILKLRDKKRVDKKFQSYVERINSLTCEQAIEKFKDILPTSKIGLRFYNIGYICVDLMKYGESKNISELLEADNCYFISMIVGRLKNLKSRGFGIKELNDEDCCTITEKIYISVLSKFLGKSLDDVIENIILKDNLVGLTFVKPALFKQFLNDLKNEIATKYEADRKEEEQRAIEGDRVNEIVNRIARQLKTTEIPEMLKDLGDLRLTDSVFPECGDSEEVFMAKILVARYARCSCPRQLK